MFAQALALGHAHTPQRLRTNCLRGRQVNQGQGIGSRRNFPDAEYLGRARSRCCCQPCAAEVWRSSLSVLPRSACVARPLRQWRCWLLQPRLFPLLRLPQNHRFHRRFRLFLLHRTRRLHWRIRFLLRLLQAPRRSLPWRQLWPRLLHSPCHQLWRPQAQV